VDHSAYKFSKDTKKSFDLMRQKSSISKRLAVPLYVARVFPMISCSFHDSLPVRPLIDILSSHSTFIFVRIAAAMPILCHLILHASNLLHWVRRSVRGPMEHLHQTLSDRRLQLSPVPGNLDLPVCVPWVAQTSSPVEWKPHSRNPFNLERPSQVLSIGSFLRSLIR